MKHYDVNFKIDIDASVLVQARSEKEAVDIVKNKMIRVIEVQGQEIEEIETEVKIILVRDSHYE